MRSRFVISENDRRSILSMYGLLTEEKTEKIKIYGKVTDIEDRVLESPAQVSLLKGETLIKGAIVNSETGEYVLEVTITDGAENISLQNINKGKYRLVARSPGLQNVEQDLEIDYEDKKIDFKLLPKSLSEVSIGFIKMTSIKFNFFEGKNKIDNCNITLSTPDKQKFYEGKVKNGFDLFIFYGLIFSNLPKNEKIIFSEQETFDYLRGDNSDTCELKKNIILNVQKDNLVFEQEYTINFNNITAQLDSLKRNIKTKEPVEFNSTIKKINEFNCPNILKINLLPVQIKVVDATTKKPLNDVSIEDITNKKTFITDTEGEISLPFTKSNVGQLSNYVIKKEGYKTAVKEIEVTKSKTIKIELQSKTTTDFSITDEMVDTFKDSMFNIYGRGKTEINNKEAIRIAKVDAINKFIKKHKRVYGNIDVGNLDPEINYELSYGRPLEKSEKVGEYSYILKFSKKDIKQYLSQFLEKEGIQIEKQPFEFEKATLDEAINDAYMNRKELMVVLGISNDEDTIDLVKELKGGGIDKKYLPIFIKVDRNDKDYLKLNNIAKFDSYPRIIILKPETPNNVKVVNSDFKINQKDADEMK
jgi:hypothetical protein